MTNNVPVRLLKLLAKEYNSGATLNELAVNYKLGVPLVRSTLVAAGVPIRKKGGSMPFAADRAEEMTRLYEGEGLTYQEIGDRHGVTRERVRQILRDNGVESQGRRERDRHEEPLNKREQAIASAYDRGVRPADLKDRYPGLTYPELQNILKRGGIATKSKGFFNRRDGYEKTVTGIIKDYLADVDTGVIAERYGLCSRTEIYKFLKREGIQVRHQQKVDAKAAADKSAPKRARKTKS